MLDILGCPVLPDSDGRSIEVSIVEGKDWDNKVSTLNTVPTMAAS